MKLYKLLFTIIFAVMPFVSNATYQTTEKIYINDVKYDLLSSPVELDDLLSAKIAKLIPDSHFVSTNLYRGYIGEWELKDEGNRAREAQDQGQDLICSPCCQSE